MTNITKFGLSLVLGLAAAALNWMWLTAEKTPPTFVAASVEIVRGEQLSDDNLKPIPVPGDMAELSESMIPYQNRAILFGTTALRDYAGGDLVFHRDIEPPEETPQWEVVGPFQLISVGERFKQKEDQDDAQFTSGGNNLTIAVDKNFDERTSRLLQVLSSGVKEEESDDDLTIIAVQVVPGNDETTTAARNDVVYQTISLNGIPNVPRVLLAGDLIRFVIPAPVQY